MHVRRQNTFCIYNFCIRPTFSRFVGCAKSQIWVTDGFVGYSEPSPKSHPDCSLGSYARGALTYTSYATSQTTMTTRYNFTSMIFDISRNRRFVGCIRRLVAYNRRIRRLSNQTSRSYRKCPYVCNC